MDWKIIIAAIFVVFSLIAFTMKTMPKAARSKENIEEEQEANEEKVTSVGTWILIYIGCSIPVFNIILLLVLACKKQYTNLTIKNWAKSVLIISLIAILLFVASCIAIFIFYRPELETFLAPYIV